MEKYALWHAVSWRSGGLCFCDQSVGLLERVRGETNHELLVQFGEGLLQGIVIGSGSNPLL